MVFWKASACVALQSQPQPEHQILNKSPQNRQFPRSITQIPRGLPRKLCAHAAYPKDMAVCGDPLNEDETSP